MPKVTRTEWQRVGIVSLGIIVMTLVPYLIGWGNSGDDWAFNGFAFGVEDGNAYLGKMRLGAEGDWSFHLFYTPEQHESAFGFYLPHMLIGHLVRLLWHPTSADLSQYLALAFQAWRIVASFALMLAIYRFIAEFFISQRLRFSAFLLATLGGGFGWLVILGGTTNFLGSSPADLLIPEGFSFWVIYGLPHIATGRTALLLGFVVFFAALRRNDVRLSLLSGVLWLVVGLMVTFYLAILYVLLAVWFVGLSIATRRLDTNFIWHAGMATGVTVPYFFYAAWVFQTNEAFAIWSQQNILPSPHIVNYVLGYGVIGFLAVAGCVLYRKRSRRAQRQPHHLLIVTWVLVVPILVYLPFTVQRRFSEAVLIPLSILAVMGLRSLAGFSTRRFKRYRSIAVGLSLPTALLLLVGTMAGLLIPGCSEARCLYRSTTERDALAWLDAYAEADDVVLGTPTRGNYLPIDTRLRPFWGLGTETLHSDEKEDLLQAFYADELSANARLSLYNTYNIRFVMWGVLEQEIAADSHMWQDDLTPIFDNGDIIIFETSR